MIDYINHRLVCWAEWATRRDDHGLGWHREAPYTRQVISHSRGNVDEINEAALEIEASVLKLRQHRSDLYDVVMEFYRKTGSAEFKAKQLHISRDTLYARLHNSHIWIMGWIQDQESLEHERIVHERRRMVA